VKIKHEEEFVVVGYTKPAGARSHFGAILIAGHRGGELLYAGHVGPASPRRSRSCGRFSSRSGGTVRSSATRRGNVA
jgi:ATP-dependent DNA ligase